MIEATELETVRVAVDWRPEGWVLINKADFAPEKHKVWTEPKPKAKTEEPAPPAA